MTKVLPNWRELYGVQAAETMPWYYAELDPDVARALATHKLAAGRVLDLGTGAATQAFALARRGFAVTASDVSLHAIERARALSRELGLAIELVVDDILNTQLKGSFELILDRGCFHVFAPEERALYLDAVITLLEPGALLFLKCLSELEPGEHGPYRFSPHELERAVGAHFDLLAIERAVYQGTLPHSPHALFCVLRRRG